jgi:hypothetical protein
MTAKLLLYGWERFNRDIKDMAINYKKTLNPNTYHELLRRDYTKPIGFDPFDVIQYTTSLPGPIDRTGFIKPYNLSYKPIPKYDETFSKSYTEVNLERSKKIWEMDDTIDVLFSGGIDSLGICLSLIETKPSNKKLRIICSESTEIEFPNCYGCDILKEFMIKKTNAEVFSVNNLTPNNIIITGEPGMRNHVGGVDLSSIKEGKIQKHYNPIGENVDDIPWTDFWKWKHIIIPHNTWLYNNADETMQTKFNDFLTEHAKQAPYEIKTYNDMRWWLAFAFRTNYTLLSVPAVIILNAPILPTKIDLSKWVGFFDNDDWQLWSMKKHATRTKDSYPYKKEAKDFIKNFLPSNYHDFVDDKHKECSLGYAPSYNKFVNWNRYGVFLLDDGRILTTAQLTPELIEDLVLI